MTDDRALELYALFLQSYRDKLHTVIVEPPALPHEKGVPSNSANTLLGLGRDHLRELSNSINDLRRWINIVAAWKPIYESCCQDEQLELLLQHITPVATLVLSAPQALRGRILYTAANGCSIANYELYRNEPKRQWIDKHLTMKIGSDIGAPWPAWPALAECMKAISTTEWSLATNDFRNEREHGHPRNIGMGITATIKTKQVDAGRQTGHGFREPIPLQTVIDTGIEGHTAVVAAYNALGVLLGQQVKALFDDCKEKNPLGIKFMSVTTLGEQI